MKIARKVGTLLTVAALLCTLFAAAAFAAENGSLWAAVEHGEGTVALIVTDTAVTDGVVKVTYDSSKLTYERTEVTAEYVAMHAVNEEEAGTVLISWVAPGPYELKDASVCLIRVHFSGREDGNTITLTGTAHDGDGNKLTVADAPDTSALEKAIADAKALDESKYTEESYDDLKEALADAETVLADATATQAEVDAAEKALKDAIAALEEVSGGTETESTGESGDEESSSTSATKNTEDNGGNSNTGDSSMIAVVIAVCVLSAAGIVLLLVWMKSKKGGAA